jgi:hypothetical protein
MERWHTFLKMQKGDKELSCRFGEVDGTLKLAIGETGNSSTWTGARADGVRLLADLAAFWGIRALIEGPDGNAVEPNPELKR